MAARLRVIFVDPREPLRQQVLEVEFRGKGSLTQRELRRTCYELIPSGHKLLRYEVV